MVASLAARRTTAAMTDTGQRLSRFLLTLTALNVAFGTFVSIALWVLGIPAPVLWGIIAGLMRFVPLLGTFIAITPPVLLAAAVDPGWNTLLMTFGVIALSEAAMGQLVEPLVQGRSAGRTPLAILVSAAFWALLWGPVGLLLAVPMTLCLVILGQHVEGLKFLHVLLGDEPAFSPGERFYQRTLAGDADRARGVPGVAQVTPIVSQFLIFDLHDEKIVGYMVGYEPEIGGGPWSLRDGRFPADAQTATQESPAPTAHLICRAR